MTGKEGRGGNVDSFIKKRRRGEGRKCRLIDKKN
jgi:hypothetical protein